MNKLNNKASLLAKLDQWVCTIGVGLSFGLVKPEKIDVSPYRKTVSGFSVKPAAHFKKFSGKCGLKKNKWRFQATLLI